jgi:Na+-translocating ferredoxin:NAD+ oxidoreductase RnfD subunit
MRVPELGDPAMAPPAVSPASIGRGSVRRFLGRYLPPVRCAWLALIALSIGSVLELGGLGIASLVVLPAVAVATDLVWSKIRFEQLRFPDAALVTGLILALLFPPTVSLAAAGACALGATTLRHTLRFRGHPWFNPAAIGAVFGALLFGIAPAWWVGVGPVDEIALLIAGALLVARAPTTWRIPVTFFVVYGIVAGLTHFLFGGVLSASLLLLYTFDAVALFFGLFMVVEPRTAVSDPAVQPLYAGTVAVAAVLLSLVLPSLGILLALLVGNLMALLMRLSVPAPSARSHPSARRSAARNAAPVAPRWPVSRRIGATIVSFFIVGVVALSLPAATVTAPLVSAPPGVGPATTSNGCQYDNPSIPSSTLSMLHQRLGPSVILSYNPNTGAVVFYDPVNHVTVSEFDLYEDFGYAEFNGDDYAVQGCSPPG